MQVTWSDSPSNGKRNIKFFIDLNAKIKSIQGSRAANNETIHRMNLEESDPRIMSKDRWPLPLVNSQFVKAINA